MTDENGKKPEPGSEQIHAGDIFIHERSGVKYFASALVRTTHFRIDGNDEQTAALQIKPLATISPVTRIEELPKAGG